MPYFAVLAIGALAGALGWEKILDFFSDDESATASTARIVKWIVLGGALFAGWHFLKKVR